MTSSSYHKKHTLINLIISPKNNTWRVTLHENNYNLHWNSVNASFSINDIVLIITISKLKYPHKSHQYTN